MEDLREEREGGSSGPGRMQCGGVRQIESAQTEQRVGKSGCSDAQGHLELASSAYPTPILPTGATPPAVG